MAYQAASGGERWGWSKNIVGDDRALSNRQLLLDDATSNTTCGGDQAFGRCGQKKQPSIASPVAWKLSKVVFVILESQRNEIFFAGCIIIISQGI
mmetsp:Transcript_40219/g.72463  ORF Transcript_40219/g.72463 Transcript_40219/m.72463 type:complete len:95 (+) Transcript_40219:39-323(+)|eukprot:CAMPEP_0201881484 /NCGR_PEP_ID=MMETSP0902-20130614/11776_1 /ASSEMBLY_ACC=CAM_ASM_000551 /TAXON_ID=420261 /ORGANISM="Thalassiosira antarctica, Strain CCMP982" /LENGTH=94 /DNA_ID=CAMNT_0048409705 /DNA_START=12 /DNA_END=296 /DNA_ORIENTATION=+